MILKDTLRKVVRSQQQTISALPLGIKRDELSLLEKAFPFALVITGIRRCGKSTLLLQLADKYGKYYYFNFEDPRAVGFEASDFEKLDEVFHEEKGSCDSYFFDEIQNVPRWELFVRGLLDRKKHVVITGSSASLFSSELGTKLTGRHIRHELFPFSFNEFLKLKKIKPSLDSFKEYFVKGGFPDFLLTEKEDALQELMVDIIARDIAVRYKIRNTKKLNEMAVYLMSNIGKEFSYNSLKKIFGLGSINSAISFVGNLEESYLIFNVPRFSASIKKQIMNPKKVYSIDNGLSKANSASFSEDSGRMLENLVFISLKRHNKRIFYFRKEGECDFIVKDQQGRLSAIQVCFELNENNKERELKGLLEAMKKTRTSSGLILTYGQEDELVLEQRKITIKPVWKWLLEQ